MEILSETRREKGGGKENNAFFNIFNRNIRGQRSKFDESMNLFEMYGINLHILCLSEHHMEGQDVLNLTLAGYSLGSSFCLQNLQKRCMYVFVSKNQSYNKGGISYHCIEQILETCSIQFETKACTNSK
jgi:hypothetical protein